MRKRIYVAGPITKGPLQQNVDQARQAGMRLLRKGYAPMVPHLTCFMANNFPEVLPDGTLHTDWYETDYPWVAVSHAVLRLPGESTGADNEVKLAHRLGIPVFYDEDALARALPVTMIDRMDPLAVIPDTITPARSVQ